MPLLVGICLFKGSLEGKQDIMRLIIHPVFLLVKKLFIIEFKLYKKGEDSRQRSGDLLAKSHK